MPRRNTKRAPSPTPNARDPQGQSTEETDSQFEMGEGSAPITKNRGPTRMGNVWKRLQADKIVLTINHANQPVGKDATTFANFIGVIARNGKIFPLSYDRWSEIPVTSKAIAINSIKKRSEIDLVSRGKQEVLHIAGTSSFAVVRERLVEEHGVDKFGNLDFFDATLMKSDDQFVSTAAATIASTARVKYAELSSTMAADPTTSNFDTLSL